MVWLTCIPFNVCMCEQFHMFRYLCVYLWIGLIHCGLELAATVSHSFQQLQSKCFTSHSVSTGYLQNTHKLKDSPPKFLNICFLSFCLPLLTCLFFVRQYLDICISVSLSYLCCQIPFFWNFPVTKLSLFYW